MKITNSTVAMASGHSFSSFTNVESMTMQARASSDLPGAILELSKDGKNKSYLEDMKEYDKEQKAELQKCREEGADRAMQQLLKNLQETDKPDKMSAVSDEMSDQYKLKLELIKRMFEMLKKGQKLSDKDMKNLNRESILDLRSESFKSGSLTVASASSSIAVSAGNAAGVGSRNVINLSTGGAAVGALPVQGEGSLWTRVTATSGYYEEVESTSFSTNGMVQTSDGRSISFGVELSMSRAFMSEINTLTSENYIMCDPLVINMDTSMAEITDQKFFFDLDSDGKEEEISFTGKGSGFIALDRNGDGKINDGSELFGTKSGDGFTDLAVFDEDENGWIDENDSVFDRLKIWTKDENGKDSLIDLKQADVGAIYLGNVDTEYQLKNEVHETNGVIRKTGIFLRESTGEVGTVNHVDLTI